MHFTGAIVKEQGVTFAVVTVKKHVVENQWEADEALLGFQPIFPGLPIVLVAQDHHGRPVYRGRQDIARFLASVPMHRIPWRKYSVQ